MERSTWTDERLDDMVARTDSQFELLRTEMAEMRSEMRSEFAETRRELTQTRSEMHGEFSDVRREMFHGVIALFSAQVVLLAAILAQSL